MSTLARDRYICIRTSVSNTHARVSFAIEIQVPRKGGLFSLSGRSNGRSSLQSSPLCLLCLLQLLQQTYPALCQQPGGTNHYWFIINKYIWLGQLVLLVMGAIF